MPSHRERELILGFLRTIDPKTGWEADRVRWPDEENRHSPDIDALADQFAIELTSLDTLPDQRRNDAWFREIVDDIELAVTSTIGCYLLIRLPYEIFTAVVDRHSVKHVLADWIRSNWMLLPAGWTTEKNISGLPFAFDVLKETRTQSGLHFCRDKPSDESLPSRLRQLLQRKAEKLKPYRAGGRTTILLVENDNLALMGIGRFGEVFEETFGAGRPDDVAEVWYVDTHRGTGPDYSRVSP